jgi:hypothetical protein
MSIFSISWLKKGVPPFPFARKRTTPPTLSYLAGVANSSAARTDAIFATPDTAKTRRTCPGRRRPTASCGITGQGFPKGNPSREMSNGDQRASSHHTGPRPRAPAMAAGTRAAASPTTAPMRSFKLSFKLCRQCFRQRTSSRSCTSRTGHPQERLPRRRQPSWWQPHPCGLPSLSISISLSHLRGLWQRPTPSLR